MPGFEVFGKEEQQAINDLFAANGGILFAHGFDGIRKGIYKVREFESEFAKYMNIGFAQAVSSGSAALKTGLKAMGVGTGDEVIIPSFTFVATAESVLECGAIPVIADINETLNLCPESFRSLITDKTKAVIPVHMLGAPAQMDEIVSIANERDIIVMEDNAQGCGGTYKGKYLGTIGQLGCFSFDAGKVMITGEGGMVVTSDEELYLKARAYHDHGHEYSSTLGRGEESAVMTGFNYRMTELQGAIGLVQLSKLQFILDQQRANKRKLKALLADLPYQFRSLADEEGELGDAIVFFLDSKEVALKYAAKMRDKGLGTKNLPDAIGWHFAKHWKHMFEQYDFYPDYFERWQKSADLLERSIAIPVMVYMENDRIEQIAETLINISREL